MADTRQEPTFETIMSDLKARRYKPVYLLMGEESYFIDKISDFIEESVMPEEERFFNQNVVYGSDVSAAQIADLAKGFPMMPSTHRVVIVKEFQSVKKFEALELYLDRPVASTILVLCNKYGSIDKRRKIVAKAKAIGVLFESKKKKETELPAFVEGYLKSHGASVDRKAAAMIADSIGSDLNRLTSELDKILVSLPEKNISVTPEIVEHQIGISKDFNAFELRDAIVNRDVFKANQIINYFEKNPKAGSLYSLLPIVFNFFQNLMVAYYTPNRNNERALAEGMELKNVWAVRDYVTGMRNYSASKALQVVGKIREVDAKSKGLDNPSTDAADLMKELLYFIFH